VLFALSYLGASFCVWWLSGFVPWFLLPDFPFLAIVFSGLFVRDRGIPVRAPPALFREITASAPSWSMFLGSMALYFASREIGRRFHLRNEPSLLSAVVSCWRPSRSPLSSSFSCPGSPFSFLWGAQEPSGSPGPPDRRSPLPGLSVRWRRVRE